MSVCAGENCTCQGEPGEVKKAWEEKYQVDFHKNTAHIGKMSKRYEFNRMASYLERQVTFSNRPPFFAWILKKKFGFDWAHNVAAFGNTIHTQFPIPDHLAVHEETHLKRQGYSKIKGLWWWAKYIASRRFRFEEELAAYRAEWQYVVKSVKDGNQRTRLLQYMAGELSGPLYGNLVKFGEAGKLITQ